MGMLQLNSIPFNTPKGPGEAFLVIDYSKEDDLMFTVILDDSGEVWTFPSHQLRGLKNITIGRTLEEHKKVEVKENVNVPPEGADWLETKRG